MWGKYFPFALESLIIADSKDRSPLLEPTAKTTTQQLPCLLEQVDGSKILRNKAGANREPGKVLSELAEKQSNALGAASTVGMAVLEVEAGNSARIGTALNPECDCS